MDTTMYKDDITSSNIAKGLESLKKTTKPKPSETNINILLVVNDTDRIGHYLSNGTGDIDDVLIEIVTQAQKILSRPYTISNKQLMVLRGLLKNQNIGYIKLVKNALGLYNIKDVPHIESLSYEKTLVIIKYVNDKLGKRKKE